MWHFILLKNYYVRRELKKTSPSGLQMGFQCYSAFTPPSLAWHICEIQVSEWNPVTALVGERVFMPEHSSSVYKS